MREETILNVCPCDDGHRRMVVATECWEDGIERLVLRQETFSDDVGWFVQSRVVVEPEQVSGLKMALTGAAAKRLTAPVQPVGPMPATIPFARSAG